MSKKIYPEAATADGFLVCHDPTKIASTGFLTKKNPLNFTTPLLLMQLSLVTVTSMLIDYCIKPFGQTTMVSQIFGGIVFGPSLLGHRAVLGGALFPLRGKITFETFATFGIMFFIFSIGVQMDHKMILRPGWKALILGVSAMLGTLLFVVPLACILRHYVSMDATLAQSLPAIAASQSISSFVNITSVLRELKMLQSDLGRLAISSAMICDVIGLSLVAVSCAVMQTPGQNPLMPVSALSVCVLFVLVLVYLIRPLILRILSQLPDGKSVGEAHIIAIFAAVLIAGLVSEIIGQHFIFGPLALGLVVPEGPPLGAALTAKLEIPVGKLLYPSFLTTSGLKTNVFSIRFRSFWMVALIVVLSCLIKIGAVMFPARYMDISVKESFVLGLMFNAKGVLELIIFNLFVDAEILDSEGFALCVLSVIAVTAIITPLIKALYGPTRRDIPIRRRTIQHSKRDSELRLLVCIHNQDDVPSMVKLLEASNATEESPITVIAVLLVELVGRAAPMLVAHQSHRNLQPSSSRSGRIINALRQYELCNETCVTIRSFSSISQFDTMHEDICRVALDQNATIIILPFHKHWEIDGSVGSVNKGIQNMNDAVTDKAPCSIAILIDRKILGGSISMLNGQSVFHVAVIYINGADDAEALSYGARIGRHPNVTLTVIRFLLFGCDNARERKFDNNLIDEVRRDNLGNENFVYQEEVVRDSVGLAASIRGLGNSFDLIMVGMHHQDSPLLVGLGTWIECPELGVIGDMLAEPDVKRTASVLVVQQQILKGKLINRALKPVVVDQDSLLPS